MTKRMNIMREYKGLDDIDSRKLTPREETELASRIQKGGPDGETAYKRLVESNIKLVITIAKRFYKTELPMSFNDVMSEGICGLLEAAKRFRPERGAKFSTYSAFWIKSYMGRALARMAHAVSIPVNIYYKRKKLDALEGGTDAELARKIKSSVDYAKHIRNKFRFYSIDYILDGHPVTDWMEIEPERQKSGMTEKDLEENAVGRLETLNDVEKFIIYYRYGMNGMLPCRLSDIAETLGRSRERIRQIEEQGLAKLKKALEAD